MASRLLYLLSTLLGLSVAALLSVHRAGLSSLGAVCPEGGGCDTVLASRYAVVLGVPLSHLGLLYYSLGVAVGLLALAVPRVVRPSALLVLAGIGVAASTVFVFIQAVLIRAFCPLCMVSACCTVAMLLSGLLARRSPDLKPQATLACGLVAAAVPALAVALVAALTLSSTPGTPLGTFDGRIITTADFLRDDPDTVSSLDDLVYRQRLEYLQRKFNGLALTAEAERRGLSRDALLKAEIDDKLQPERERVLQTARELSPDDPDRAAQIADTMLGDIRAERVNTYLESLVARHQTRVLLPAPLGRPVELDPALSSPGYREGPADAPLQLTVFSDLQCPICADLDAALAELRTRFGDKLAITYRHFPLQRHEHAVLAAMVGEAVVNAGKPFSAYKSHLFAHKGDINPQRIDEAAIAAGLSAEQFAAARENPDLRARIEASAAEARRNRFDGAPVLILNGRVLGGYFDTDTLETKLRQRLP